MEFDVDDAGQRAGQRTSQYGHGQGQQRACALFDHQRGHGSAQRERRIHGHIRKIEDFERDVYAQSENGVDKALLKNAQKQTHKRPPK